MSESNTSVYAVRIATVLSRRLAPKVTSTLGKTVQYGCKLHVDGAGDVAVYTKLDGSKPKMVENYPAEVKLDEEIPTAVRRAFGEVVMAAAVATWREGYDPMMTTTEAATLRKEIAKFMGLEDTKLKAAILAVLRCGLSDQPCPGRKPSPSPRPVSEVQLAMREYQEKGHVLFSEPTPVVRPDVTGLIVPACPKCSGKMHPFYSRDKREFWGCQDRKCSGIRRLVRPLSEQEAEAAAYAAYLK